MTTYSKAQLKTFFENGDVPQGGDFANLIDSYLNVVDTSPQSLSSNLSLPTVSATDGNFSNNLSVSQTISANNMSVFGIISANNISMSGILSANTIVVYDKITASAATFQGLVSAGSITINSIKTSGLTVDADISANSGTVYCSSMRSTSGLFGQSPVPIVSAAGTTQGAATVLTVTPVVRGQGTADGTATGYALPANKAGMIQYFYHEGTVSGNLWPPTGGNINALANNAAFPLVASTLYTIIHKSASAYAVK